MTGVQTCALPIFDSRSRVLASELIEERSHKHARVISQAEVDNGHQPHKNNAWILWACAPIIVAEVLKFRPVLKPER